MTNNPTPAVEAALDALQDAVTAYQNKETDYEPVGDARAALLALLAEPRPEAKRPLKLLGYANPFRIKQTCADKPGGAHLGQVAIYAGESVDPMEIQERENPTWMGEPLPMANKNGVPE